MLLRELYRVGSCACTLSEEGRVVRSVFRHLAVAVDAPFVCTEDEPPLLVREWREG